MSLPLPDAPPALPTDRECLRSWRRQRSWEHLKPILERYLSFVYSSAHRRAGNAEQAREVTRAVFLVLARRAARLRRKTVMVEWLFRITSVACRKLGVRRRRPWLVLRRPPPVRIDENDASAWPQLASELDAV